MKSVVEQKKSGVVGGHKLSLSNQSDTPTTSSGVGETIKGNIPSLGVQSAMNRAVQLQRELDQIKNQAIEELLEQRKAFDEQLRVLGWQAPQAKVYASTPKSPSKRATSEGKMCPICQIIGHDGRAHRGQGNHKEPFTRDQLIQLGLPTGEPRSSPSVPLEQPPEPVIVST
jgi:hypothetical protein